VFCPICRDEYRTGFTWCADCENELVVELPEETPDRYDLVTVLEAGGPAVVAIAKSLLDSADIPYVARNETLQDLFGGGRVGTGFNIAMGPVQFQVPRGREEEARALLTEVPRLREVPPADWPDD
jgi:hypothetical protein